jgi:hypothetical protein
MVATAIMADDGVTMRMSFNATEREAARHGREDGWSAMVATAIRADEGVTMRMRMQQREWRLCHCGINPVRW